MIRPPFLQWYGVGKHKHCECYIQEHKENIRLRRIIREKEEGLEKRDRRIAELEKRLRYYENPNCPPSANSLLWKKQKKERKEERRREGNCEPKKPGRMAIKEYRIPSGQQRPLSIKWIDARSVVHQRQDSPTKSAGQ